MLFLYIYSPSYYESNVRQKVSSIFRLISVVVVVVGAAWAQIDLQMIEWIPTVVGFGILLFNYSHSNNWNVNIILHSVVHTIFYEKKPGECCELAWIWKQKEKTVATNCNHLYGCSFVKAFPQINWKWH